MMERKIRNLRRGEQKKHLEMLNLCFNPWGSEEKWIRLYSQPEFDISKNMFVVEENDQWIGGVTLWFRNMFVKRNKTVKVCIAGDGYVHPDHRGKGVYSTFMRNANKIAQKERASLGLCFVSVLEVPFVALPRYGYVDIFYPETRILVINPEKFIRYILKQTEAVIFPQKFENMKMKLVVSVPSLEQKLTVTKIFQIKAGRLCELTDGTDQKTDLQIATDANTLHKVFMSFYRKRKTAYLILFVSLLRRRLKLRFSMKFLKAFLGL